MDLIEGGDADAALSEVEKRFERHMGLVFEDACRAFARQSLGYRTVGRWWGPDPGSKTQAEIGLVASMEEGGRRIGLFGECEFTREKMGADALESLISRSRLVGGFDERRHALFSRSGFTEGARNRAEETGAMLFGLGDLYP